MAFSPDETAAPEARPPAAAWQQRALARSLGDARARSMERLDQFVEAARGLAASSGSANFTVQQVVAESGQSLKSFYRHFGGKDDLLLALVEDDCSMGALLLREIVDQHRTPEARLRAWVTGVFELMAVGESGYVAVLVREHRRLGEQRPDEMDAALAPFVDHLAGELGKAMDLGVARRGDPARDARTVFQLVLGEIHELVLGRAASLSRGTADGPGPTVSGTRAAGMPPVVDTAVVDPARAARIRESADYVWNFCWAGLAGSEPRGAGR